MMKFLRKLPKNKQYFSLRSTISILVCFVVIIVLLVTDILISKNITKKREDTLKEKITDIARTVARSSIVIDGLSGTRDETEIQSYSNQIKDVTNVSFVVVLDMNLIRKSHPDPQAIGYRFLDVKDATPSLQGKEYVSIARGVLGNGMRVFTPVVNKDGKQIGVVTVGILLDEVKQDVAESQSIIYVGTVIGLLVGVIGALLLARHIKKILFGLEPSEIAMVLEERDAMIHSLKDGVFAVDRTGKITLVNAGAIRLLQLGDIADHLIGKDAGEYMDVFQEVLDTGNPEFNREQYYNGVLVLINCVPVRVDDEIVGAIATFRDKTEVKKLAEQLTGVQLYTDALRAQSHEFMNKLHVILGMVHMEYYDKLGEYVQEIVHEHKKEIGFIMKRIKSPVFAGFLLGKYSDAREDGVELIINQDSYLPEAVDSDVIHDLVKITGNLINNAIEAMHGCKEKKIIVSIDYDAETKCLYIEVKDTGKGIERDIRENIFTKGFSTKGENRGLGLFFVQQSLRKLQGDLQLRTVVGKGTTFRIKLPYEVKEEAE
ncbi:DcuS/MalK family sensor histidine kinase [Microbacteriaceae bacterium 4G12]